jgi:transcriptional regulator with XRE-family HTH domain
VYWNHPTPNENAMAKRQNLEERFLELRMEGKTYQAISEELGVSKQSLFNWSKDRNISDLLKFAHLCRLQAIARKYQISREAKLESFGRFIQSCMAELETRNLAEVPTEKLFKVVLELQKQVQTIVPKPHHFEPLAIFGMGVNEDFDFDVLD